MYGQDIFCGNLWNSIQNIVPIHWKMCNVLISKNWWAKCFWTHPPHPSNPHPPTPPPTPHTPHTYLIPIFVRSMSHPFLQCFMEFPAWSNHTCYKSGPKPNISFHFTAITALSILNIGAYWHRMVSEIWVNIGSGNGLLPDGTKPLSEPMLTDHQWSPVAFIEGQFHKRCFNHQSLKSVWKLHV